MTARHRLRVLVGIVALAHPAAAAQSDPVEAGPAATEEMIVPAEEIVATDPYTGARSRFGFAVYPDSTAVIWGEGTDTLRVPWYILTSAGVFANQAVAQEEAYEPVFWWELREDEVYVYLLRIVPLPAAIAMGLFLPVLFGLTVLFFSRRLRQERRQRHLLQTVGTQLARGREDERLRLARELHDGPVQDLHALRMQLSVAAETMTTRPDDPQVFRRIVGAEDEVQRVVGDLRGVAEALRPPALGPFGLAAALRAHVARFRERHPQIELRLDLAEDGQSLSEAKRLALFRIAQEAMTNASKHGAPSTIEITLRLFVDRVELTVVDDGSGLEAVEPDVQSLAGDGHLGLLGMAERASLIGARLRITSPRDSGVHIRVVSPRASMPEPSWHLGEI